MKNLSLLTLSLGLLIGGAAALPQTTYGFGHVKVMRHGGGALNVMPIQPSKYGWGQSIQVGFLVTMNGAPVKNADVRFWLSGQKGRQTGAYYCTTGNDGKAYRTFALPGGSDKDYFKWLDLNATVDRLGLSNGPNRILG